MTTQQQLLKQIQDNWQETIKTCKTTPPAPHLIRELAEYTDQEPIQHFLANYPDTPSRLLNHISINSNNPQILSQLAKHPRTPKETLQQLARHQDTTIRLAIANNRQISPQVANILIKDPIEQIRIALAKNPAITQRIQSELSTDPSPQVRIALLQQKYLAQDILLNLCEDSDIFIQAKTIIHSPLPTNKQLTIADSNDPFTQSLLLQRKELPNQVLEALTFSQNQQIQQQAIQRKQLTNDELVGWAEHGETNIRCLIAKQNPLPKTIQQIIANDPNTTVLTTLATNPTLHPQIAIQLLQKTQPKIWHALATNPNITHEIINTLIDTKNQQTLQIIANRKDLQPNQILTLISTQNPEICYQLANNNLNNPDITTELTTKLAQHRLPTIRQLAAASHHLNQHTLAKLRIDPAPKVRRKLARNTTIPPQILQLLTQDPDNLTASFATETLQQTKTITQKPQTNKQTTKKSTPLSFINKLINKVIKQ